MPLYNVVVFDVHLFEFQIVNKRQLTNDVRLRWRYAERRQKNGRH